jgi:hypothetical protein
MTVRPGMAQRRILARSSLSTPAHQEAVMDELIQQVQARTGINADQARTAVETVVGFIKERLPEPMRGQVDALLSGQAAGGDNPLAGLGNLGNLDGG